MRGVWWWWIVAFMAMLLALTRNDSGVHASSRSHGFLWHRKVLRWVQNKFEKVSLVKRRIRFLLKKYHVFRHPFKQWVWTLKWNIEWSYHPICHHGAPHLLTYLMGAVERYPPHIARQMYGHTFCRLVQVRKGVEAYLKSITASHEKDWQFTSERLMYGRAIRHLFRHIQPMHAACAIKKILAKMYRHKPMTTPFRERRRKWWMSQVRAAKRKSREERPRSDCFDGLIRRLSIHAALLNNREQHLRDIDRWVLAMEQFDDRLVTHYPWHLQDAQHLFGRIFQKCDAINPNGPCGAEFKRHQDAVNATTEVVTDDDGDATGLTPANSEDESGQSLIGTQVDISQLNDAKQAVTSQVTSGTQEDIPQSNAGTQAVTSQVTGETRADISQSNAGTQAMASQVTGGTQADTPQSNAGTQAVASEANAEKKMDAHQSSDDTHAVTSQATGGTEADTPQSNAKTQSETQAANAETQAANAETQAANAETQAATSRANAERGVEASESTSAAQMATDQSETEEPQSDRGEPSAEPPGNKVPPMELHLSPGQAQQAGDMFTNAWGVNSKDEYTNESKEDNDASKTLAGKQAKTRETMVGERVDTSKTVAGKQVDTSRTTAAREIPRSQSTSATGAADSIETPVVRERTRSQSAAASEADRQETVTVSQANKIASTAASKEDIRQSNAAPRADISEAVTATKVDTDEEVTATKVDKSKAHTATSAETGETTATKADTGEANAGTGVDTGQGNTATEAATSKSTATTEAKTHSATSGVADEVIQANTSESTAAAQTATADESGVEEPQSGQSMSSAEPPEYEVPPRERNWTPEIKEKVSGLIRPFRSVI